MNRDLAGGWLVLTATLPAGPSALRVRIWRALKATGAATLRDGVYLLPAGASTAPALADIEKGVIEGGADAHMLVVAARDERQEQRFRALFDRSELYDELIQSIKEARRSIRKASEAELHRSLRGLEQQFAATQASDFFPTARRDKAAQALQALRREVELHLAPDEPMSSTASIDTLSIGDFQGRTWATRKRPWIDRLATAWLVQRFVDRSPRFVWITDPKKCPRSAVGYDFDGARFTHVGDRVTFEVMTYAFGLDQDPALKRLGEIVHYLDVGGIPADEAPGLEAVVRGLQAQHTNDDALLAASLPLFDGLHSGLTGRR